MKKKFRFLNAVFFVFAIVVLNFSIVFAEGLGGSSSSTSDCDSGGPGSSTCGVTYSLGGSGGGGGVTGEISCSVECISGYYACCNLTTTFPFVHCTCKGYS